MYLQLKEQGIFARRYFYPLLTDLPMYSIYPSATSANLPNATRVARQVLCLPIHQDLSEADVERVIAAVLGRPGERS